MKKLIEIVIISIIIYIIQLTNIFENIHVYLVFTISISLLLILDRNFFLNIILIAFIFLLYSVNKSIYLFFPIFMYSNLSLFFISDKNIMKFIISISMISMIIIIFLNKDLQTIGLSLFAVYLAINTQIQLINSEKMLSSIDNLKEGYINLEKKSDEQAIKNLEKEEFLLLKERDRIARSLHDSIGHTISSSIVQLEMIALINQDRSINGSLKTLKETLLGGMDEIRSYLYNLRDSSLDLEKELNKIAENVKQIKVDILYNIEAPSYSIKEEILSISKEVISNTLKHSDAENISIGLFENEEYYILELKDDGKKEPLLIIEGIGFNNFSKIAKKNRGSFNYYYKDGFNIHLVLKKGIHDENIDV